MSKSIPAGHFFFVFGDEHEELEDLRAVLRVTAGRRLLRRLLSVGNTLGVSMAADTRRTEYNEGQRAVGLWLATKIEEAAPGELPKLMLESSNDKLAHNATQRRKSDDD